MTERKETAHREVACLQRMLGELAGAYPRLLPVEADGIFDERTLEALMIFQREFCPPVTGRPDPDTWRTLEQMYRRLEQERAQAIFHWGMPGDLSEVRPGEDKACLAPVKFMFRQLADVLDGIEPDQPDTRHGEPSVRNVRWLQQAAQMEPDGVVCPQVWDMLTRLYDMCVVRRHELRAAEREGKE